MKFLVLLLLTSFQGTYSSKILLAPTPIGSHFHWMVNLGQTLLSRGHNVTIIAFKHHENDANLKGFSVLGYKSYREGYKTTEDYMNNFMDQRMRTEFEGKAGFWDTMAFLKHTGISMKSEGRQLLMNNSEVMNKIKTGKFDMVIVDGNPFNSFNYLIPYKFDIPYITITSFWDYAMLRVPMVPMAPLQMMEISNKMTSTERFTSAVATLTLTMAVSVFNVIVDSPADTLLAEFAPEKPYKPQHQIQSESRLFLMYVAPPLDYPRATLPHVITVPALNIKHPKRISDPDLLSFADGAKNGFIIVSLGSYVNWMPPHISNKFVDAFRDMKQRIIWKYNGKDIEKLPDNIRLMSWIPQNDLLAHPNANLFISHCGNNGQYEAVWHGVPILGVPILVDQKYNSVRLIAHGYGLSINVRDFTVEEMVFKMKEIIYNPEYAERVKRASAILRDDPLLPSERASVWIEHVIKFGSDHLRAPAIDLPWYQYYMLDFLVFLMVVLTAIVVILLCTIRCLYNFVKNRFFMKQKKD